MDKTLNKVPGGYSCLLYTEDATSNHHELFVYKYERAWYLMYLVYDDSIRHGRENVFKRALPIAKRKTLTAMRELVDSF